MSQWTHVIGTVYCYTGKDEFTDMFKTFDPWALTSKVERGEVTQEEYDKRFKEINVPIGSEGPLLLFESKDHLDPDSISKELRAFSFYGDLRDYGGKKGIKKIIDWWKGFHENLWIRQSTLQIMDDWSEDVIVVNCFGKCEKEKGKKRLYKFSTVSIPRCGRRKNPKNYEV